MSPTPQPHRAVTALLRSVFRLDHSGMTADGFAAAFMEELVATLGAGPAALIHEGQIRAVGLPADAAALADDKTLAWAHDRDAGAALALRGADAEIVEAVLAIFVNAIERKRADERLVHDAFHDPLTGLPNRSLFVEHLERARERARRSSGYLFSVLYIDLDRFKRVNDSLGHEAGDQLLIGFAQRLRRVVRGGDVVARLGSDEFAILADDLSELNDALQMASRIHGGLRTPFTFEKRALVVGASMGVARNAPRYDHGSEMLRDAAIAMRRAKQAGGNTHRMFDTDMHTATVTRMQTETDLRQAVGGNQLRLAYQPIIRVADGALAGFEALLRWRHPTRGSLLPAEFIATAEESGLIVPIGRWTLAEVCRRLAVLNRDSPQPLTVSINLSDREALEPGLVDGIADALAASGVAPETLHFELTERMLMANASLETEVLPQLKALGVRLMIDDFGTGQSSLSRLQRLPIDSLKIDYSFIREIGGRRETAEIVRAVVALAHNLGISVVAEGVEQTHQLELLQEAGCDYAQGYLFSEPLDDGGVAPVLDRAVWLPA